MAYILYILEPHYLATLMVSPRLLPCDNDAPCPTDAPIVQVHELDPTDPACRGMRSAFKIVLDGGKTIVLNTLDPADRQKWVHDIDLAASDSFKVVDDESRKQLENRLETERLMRDRDGKPHHRAPQQN